MSYFWYFFLILRTYIAPEYIQTKNNRRITAKIIHLFQALEKLFKSRSNFFWQRRVLSQSLHPFKGTAQGPSPTTSAAMTGEACLAPTMDNWSLTADHRLLVFFTIILKSHMT